MVERQTAAAIFRVFFSLSFLELELVSFTTLWEGCFLPVTIGLVKGRGDHFILKSKNPTYLSKGYKLELLAPVFQHSAAQLRQRTPTPNTEHTLGRKTAEESKSKVFVLTFDFGISKNEMMMAWLSFCMYIV